MKKPIQIKIEEQDFGYLRTLCQDYIDTLSKNQFIDDEEDHYIFEAAMEAIFGKNVWEYVNHKLK